MSFGKHSFYVSTIGCSQPGCTNPAVEACGCYLTKNGQYDPSKPCPNSQTGQWTNYDVQNGGWSCTFTWNEEPSAPFVLYGLLSLNGSDS